MGKYTILKICSVEDCPNPYKAKGYCNKHYLRVQKHGRADPKSFKMLQERFDQCHRKDGPTQPHMETACWEWVGSGIDKDGYGRFGYNYKLILAHRVSFFLRYGYWPINALHKCDYRRCVNPDHLYDGTAKDNTRDAVERGLHPTGERSHFAKLTNDQVIEIKQRILQGEPNKDIAPDYRVSVWAISCIRHNRSWKQIPWQVS